MTHDGNDVLDVIAVARAELSANLTCGQVVEQIGHLDEVDKAQAAPSICGYLYQPNRATPVLEVFMAVTPERDSSARTFTRHHYDSVDMISLKA